MHVDCLCAQVYFVEERAVIRMCRETLVLLFEHDGIRAFLRVTVRVVTHCSFQRRGTSITSIVNAGTVCVHSLPGMATVDSIG
jgi:hypothetical protein